MTAKEIIESGLLELYAIGETTDEEKEMIEALMSFDKALQYEYDAILKSLDTSDTNKKLPSQNVLRNIFDSIAQADAEKFNLPPLLSPRTNIDEWRFFLIKHNIEKPLIDKPLLMIEIMRTNTLVTYVAWAKKGAVLEEIHHEQLERLFMLQGSCKIEFKGVTHFYSVGDFIEIPAGTLHRAEATGDGVMILLGQRVAG